MPSDYPSGAARRNLRSHWVLFTIFWALHLPMHDLCAQVTILLSAASTYPPPQYMYSQEPAYFNHRKLRLSKSATFRAETWGRLTRLQSVDSDSLLVEFDTCGQLNICQQSGRRLWITIEGTKFPGCSQSRKGIVWKSF